MKNFRPPSAGLCKTLFTLGVMAAGAAIPTGLLAASDDIQVETFDYPESPIKAVRIEAVIDAPVSAVMAVFADVQRYPEWIYNCTRAEPVGQGSFHSFTAYQVSNMPWPVTDRDLVLTFETEETATGGFLITLANKASEVPLGAYVRVAAAHGFYHLEPLSETSTLFRSEQHFDPSGDIPTWLVNQLLEDIPKNSVKGMRKIVQEAKYQARQLTRDGDGRIVGWADRP